MSVESSDSRVIDTPEAKLSQTTEAVSKPEDQLSRAVEDFKKSILSLSDEVRNDSGIQTMLTINERDLHEIRNYQVLLEHAKEIKGDCAKASSIA